MMQPGPNTDAEAVAGRYEFTKMHGAGNDFVVIDLRSFPAPSADLCAFLADRHKGIGCDLILGVDTPNSDEAVASYRIWTGDGKPSMQCGNGARCIAAWVIREGLNSGDSFVLDSPSGPVEVCRLEGQKIRVSLRPPEIPTDKAWPVDVQLGSGETFRCFPVSTGNPHAVVEVSDIELAPVSIAGPALQECSVFPETVNIGFAKVVSRQQIELRVFEFGAGETLACGTGACAAAATFIRQGRVDRSLKVSLRGGDLEITWPADAENILMDGPAQFTFQGEFLNAAV